MKNIHSLVLSIMLLLGACAYHKTILNEKEGKANTEANASEGVAGHIIWVKNKADRMDINLMIINNYDFPVAFDTSSWKLMVNGTPASLHFQEFIGKIPKGGMIKGILLFDYMAEIKGPVKANLTLDTLKVDPSNEAGKVSKVIGPLNFTFAAQ
jgi:hypothetical protein